MSKCACSRSHSCRCTLARRLSSPAFSQVTDPFEPALPTKPMLKTKMSATRQLSARETWQALLSPARLTPCATFSIRAAKRRVLCYPHGILCAVQKCILCAVQKCILCAVQKCILCAVQKCILCAVQKCILCGALWREAGAARLRGRSLCYF